jgi:hypothetical protein
MERLRALRGRPAVAAILVSVLTLVVVGSVIITTTSLGCGPAQKLGLKGLLNHCKASGPVAVVTSSPGPSGSPTGTPTTFPPFTPPASATDTPPPLATPPDTGPASGAYPPYYPPASGSGSTVVPGRTLSCRLPVYVGPAGSGGFIVFPGGSYVADPSSAVTIPSPSPGSPSPPPYGQGYAGLSYDRAYSRWLPVPFTNVSPDGSRYAHVSPDSIYVENVATGVTTELGVGHAWAIVGVENQGVYASIINQAGLWLLPYSGAAQQITSTGYWQLASADAAYGTTTSAVPQGVANTIIRLDLKTGAVANWFIRGGAQSSVFGFDAHGYPLMYVNYFASGGGYEMWLASSPTNWVPIFGSGQGLTTYGPPIADSNGVWFPMYYNSTSGIALYVAGSGFYWMSSLGTQLSGGCA